MTGAPTGAKAKATTLPPLAPTCRVFATHSFLPLIHRPQASFQYDLFEPQPLTQGMDSQFTQEQLTALLGATPTEEDTSRAARIVESIRNVSYIAESFTYEMFDAHKPRDEGYESIYLNYKGAPVPSGDVNMTHCYRLLPIKDQQKYANYWAILRLRPGSRYPAVPEYMPNATYSFEDVSKDFQLSGLPLAYCRYWTEAPLNIFKVAHLYPFYGYLPGNEISLTKFNKTLRLHRIPYKTELIYHESAPDAQGGNRATAQVNIEASMANLLRLRVIPNDTKATLDAYLLKVQESIEKIRKYQLRIPFATGQMVIDAQLLCYTALEKTIRHIAAPRLTYGRVVNNPDPPPRPDDIEIDQPPREGNPIGAEAGNEPPDLEERLYASSSSSEGSEDSQEVEGREPATYQAAEQRNQDRLDLEGHGGNN
jgi:hypothetical protein